MALTVPFNSHDIRVTNQNPFKASVIDVISAVTSKDTKHSADAFSNLLKRFPEVSQSVGVFKFPGRGQRDTPVADARGIWKIITLLPGKAAAIFRDKSGDVMIRFLGGDESLISEIRANKAMQEEIAVNDPNHPLRFIGKTIESEEKDRTNHHDAAPRFNEIMLQRQMLELEEMKSRIAERNINIKRMEFELMNDVANSFANDERDELFLKDAKRTCLRRVFDSQGLLENGTVELPKRELSISEVAKSLHMSFKNHGDLIKYGRAAAKLYREERGTNPSTCRKFVNGGEQEVKCYYEDDRDLLVRAIQSTV
jgi:hypothetical protein